jgi:translation elongation factor Ts
MAEITAALVKELRDTTGAGMMDCKRALTEADGNLQDAIDWLRKKGLSAAAKKSGRVAAEGLVGTASAPNRAAMVEVNAETDFVARNDASWTGAASASRPLRRKPPARPRTPRQGPAPCRRSGYPGQER